MKPGTWPRLLGAGLVVSGAYDLIEEVALIVNQPALLERAGTTFWVNYGIVIVLNMALIWAGFAMVSRRPSRRRAVTIIFALGALHQTYTLVTSWVNVWSHRGINIPAFLIAVTWLVIWWGALAYMIVTWRRPEFQRRLNVPAAQPEPPEHHRVVAAKITDGPNWHEQLLASLHETGTQPTPRPRRWPLILAFIGILIGARLLAEGINLGMAGANPQWLAFIWLILAFGLTLAVGLPLAAVRRRLAQARARSAEDALKRAGAKRPIFYLRSFALDDEVGRPSVLELLLNLQPANPEQAMTRVIARCGPVIAIGRPGEGLPALGAARFYVDHSLWQEKVADVATVAQAVVWASGTTVGLQWEITHLVRSLPPEKLILWAHPWLLDLDPDEREVQWAAFVDGLGGLFPKPLPKPLGNTRFFAFDKDFTPIPFAAHRPTREGSLLHSMRDLLASKGIAPYDPVHLARIRRRRRIALGLFGAFVAAIVLGAAYLFVDYVRPKAPTVYNWNILAENLVHDESFASPANADEVLRRLQSTVDALDGHWFGPNWENTEPGRLPPLKVMAQHYLAAFRAAHADPQIELVFSLKRTALAIDAKTPADAKAMSQRLVAVRAALTNADNDWVAIKSETSGAFYCDKIRSLLETREKLFEAEGALLDFLANNPTGWSSQMLLTGAPRLLFNTPELLTQAQKLAAQRDAAAQALITAYGKD